MRASPHHDNDRRWMTLWEYSGERFDVAGRQLNFMCYHMFSAIWIDPEEMAFLLCTFDFYSSGMFVRGQQFPDWESFGGIAGLELNADGVAR